MNKEPDLRQKSNTESKTDRMARWISSLDKICFETRAPVKEAALWLGTTGAGIVCIVNFFMTPTMKLFDEEIMKRDILKDNDYFPAAICLAVGQIFYIGECAYLVFKRKVGHWMDLSTPIIEFAFWVIISCFGVLLTTSDDCDNGMQIFTCQKNGRSRENRWPNFWIIALCKLVIDASLFVYFWLIKRRSCSLTHGQTLSRLLLDTQYLLISLWFGEYIERPPITKILSTRKFYNAKVLFNPLFIGILLAPLYIVASLILLLIDCKRKHYVKGFSWLVIASFWGVMFSFVFLFDAVAGEVSATYFLAMKVVCIVAVSVYGFYGLVNTLLKSLTGYGPYIKMAKYYDGVSPKTSEVEALQQNPYSLYSLFVPLPLTFKNRSC